MGSNENRAIVINYFGEQVDDSIIAAITAAVQHLMPIGASADIHTYNSEELSNLIAATSKIEQEPKVVIENDSVKAVESAVVIIGTRYAEYLAGKEKNIALFASAISIDAAKGLTTDSEDELRKSIDVLTYATAPILIKTKNVRAKYHVTSDILDVIRKVQKALCTA